MPNAYMYVRGWSNLLLPAMTMQERVNEIQNQIRRLEAYGCTFR